MAKTRRRRKNPIGTLLVNSGRKRKGGSRRTAKRSKRSVSLASLLSRSARSNPRKRRSSKRRGHRRNPITIGNPRRRRSSKRHARRRNPITIGNPRRRGSKRRRNPASMFGGIQRKAQGILGKIPLVGGILATAVGLVGGAIGGAIGVLPAEFVLPYVEGRMPTWLRPYGYTITGVILGGVVKAIPMSVPYKAQLITGLAAAGGAVDMYRYRHGQSQNLAGEYGDYGDEYGDADFGNDGEPLAAVEYADADLSDANYCGEDLSDEEMAAAELGRAAYRKRFQGGKRGGTKRAAMRSRRAGPAGGGAGGVPGEASASAGMPGERWGWLIYWIGFDNFQKVASLPDDQRRDVINKFRHEALLAARKLLTQNLDTSVVSAETAGLLVAA